MEFKHTAVWSGGISFTTEIMGFDVLMDSGVKGESKGPSPKRMLLASLLTCTGMDVVSLLDKMRVPYTAFRIEGIAPLTEEHPKVFSEVRMKYIVEGEGIKRDKVEKAINLSQDRYCGVSIMLKKHCPITWELEIVSGV